MIKLKTKREFKLSYAELSLLANTKTQFASRDLEKFAEYGYTTESINQIIAKNNELEQTPSDQQMEGAKMILTEQKEQLVEQLMLMARKTLTVVSRSYPIDSAFFRQFQIKSLTKLSDSELTYEVNKLIALSEQYQPLLESDGMTQERIDTLKDLRNQLNDVILQKIIAESERAVTTDKRISLANEIYKEIAVLCNTGKSIWIDQNEARYNDYIISKSKTTIDESQTDNETVTQTTLF